MKNMALIARKNFAKTLQQTSGHQHSIHEEHQQIEKIGRSASVTF